MIMALSSVLMTSLAVRSGLNPLSGHSVGILVGRCFGLLNGLLVTPSGCLPFIVTLGTFNIAFALTRIYTTSTITICRDAMMFFGNTFKIGGTDITYGSVLMFILYAHRLVCAALDTGRALGVCGGR